MRIIFQGILFCIASQSLGLGHVLPTSAQDSMAVLGKGYNSVQERFTGDCARGDFVYVGAPTASVSFDRSLSSEEASSSLGFAAGAKARYGVISGSAAARFALDSSSSDHSEATIYSAEYLYKNAKLSTAELSDVGKKAHGSGLLVGENWESTCGNEYVEQIRLGAKLLISAKVDFATKEDKMSFAAEFKIKGPAFSASGELRKASHRFGKTASVSIRAFQLGGDVSRLSSIFGVGNNAKVDLDGRKVHALLVCSMDNIAACTQVLDSALTYATDTSDPNGFPNQIKSNYNPQNPDGPAELAYITKPWSDLAIYSPPPIMAAIIKEARSDLARIFEDVLILKNRINALASGTFRLSPRQIKNIRTVGDAISRDLASILTAVEICYFDSQQCPEHVANLRKQLLSGDKYDLEIYPEIFSQWCDAADSGILKIAAKETLKRLINIAERDMDLSKVHDRCGEAERILKEKTFIDISSYDSWESPVQSLSPLQSLSQVQVLWMAHNAIEDLSPLQDFKNLRDLNVNKNYLSNIATVTHLENLETLKLNANKISKLPSGLEKLSKLAHLEIGANSLSDLSHLNNLQALTTLYVGVNAIASISPLAGITTLKYLDVSNNHIKDLSLLEKLNELVEVDVYNNSAECPLGVLRKSMNMEL